MHSQGTQASKSHKKQLLQLMTIQIFYLKVLQGRELAQAGSDVAPVNKVPLCDQARQWSQSSEQLELLNAAAQAQLCKAVQREQR